MDAEASIRAANGRRMRGRIFRVQSGVSRSLQPEAMNGVPARLEIGESGSRAGPEDAQDG
jgi:hypothetical protein